MICGFITHAANTVATCMENTQLREFESDQGKVRENVFKIACNLLLHVISITESKFS